LRIDLLRYSTKRTLGLQKPISERGLQEILKGRYFRCDSSCDDATPPRVQESQRKYTRYTCGKDGSAGWRIALAAAVILLVLQIVGSFQFIDASLSQALRTIYAATLGFVAGASATRLTRARDGGEVAERWEAIMSRLVGDEKELYGVMLREGGAMLQSELCQRLSYSKSKLSRVLAKMEARGVLERKRSGMTNLIILR